MPINVFLVRWNDGWREVKHQPSIDAHGRREALLGLGAQQSPQEVDRVAGEQLAIFSDNRMAIAADHLPMGPTDQPYRSYNVADVITVPNYGGGTIAQRVRAITGSEDDNGDITYSPELGDLILEQQERQLLALKKMADGTVDGESPVATPVSTIANVKVFGSSPWPAAMPYTLIITEIPDMAFGESTTLYSIPGGTDFPVISMEIVTHGTNDDTVVVEAVQVGGGSFTAYRGIPAGSGPWTWGSDIYNSPVHVGGANGVKFTATGPIHGGATITLTLDVPGQPIYVPWGT